MWLFYRKNNTGFFVMVAVVSRIHYLPDRMSIDVSALKIPCSIRLVKNETE